MIHNIYFKSKHAAISSTLYHNKNYLGCVQSHKSPFHYKKEMATQAFDVKVIVLFYHLFLNNVHHTIIEQVDNYIIKLSPASFLYKIEKIHQYIFTVDEQSLKKLKSINYEFSAHAKFLQQIKIYKTLKYIIKYVDVDFIQYILA